ncbi:hypothetical protein WJX74_000891 [Apatococcus lobatus]|uniref:Uncharacterized protein n=1 Tax=Apatococcus lobatus TaxID=904363 RepID=A0AAW1R1Y8_9CHLO
MKHLLAVGRPSKNKGFIAASACSNSFLPSAASRAQHHILPGLVAQLESDMTHPAPALAENPSADGKPARGLDKEPSSPPPLGSPPGQAEGPLPSLCKHLPLDYAEGSLSARHDSNGLPLTRHASAESNNRQAASLHASSKLAHTVSDISAEGADIAASRGTSQADLDKQSEQRPDPHGGSLHVQAAAVASAKAVPEAASAVAVKTSACPASASASSHQKADGMADGGLRLDEAAAALQGTCSSGAYPSGSSAIQCGSRETQGTQAGSWLGCQQEAAASPGLLEMLQLRFNLVETMAKASRTATDEIVKCRKLLRVVIRAVIREGLTADLQQASAAWQGNFGSEPAAGSARPLCSPAHNSDLVMNATMQTANADTGQAASASSWQQQQQEQTAATSTALASVDENLGIALREATATGEKEVAGRKDEIEACKK